MADGVLPPKIAGNAHIARQQKIIAELERDGDDSALAKAVLGSNKESPRTRSRRGLAATSSMSFPGAVQIWLFSMSHGVANKTKQFQRLRMARGHSMQHDATCERAKAGVAATG
jgi:hypothetical protein